MARAGRPKNGSAKLPDWFNIEKYRDIRTHGAGQWFQQFAFRKQLFDHYHVFQTPGQEGGETHEREMPENNSDFEQDCDGYEVSEEYCPPASESWTRLCKLLWEHPVITQGRIIDASAYRDESGALRVDSNDANVDAYYTMEIYEKGVRELTNQEIYDAYRSFPDQTRKTLGDSNHSFAGECLFAKPGTISQDVSDAYRFLDTACALPRVTLDFSLPNEILLAGVEDFLNEKRKQLGNVVSPFFKVPDFSDWYNCGVLPYLDLLLWEKITGEPIYWSVFVDAINNIADRPIGGEGALRKTTKRHAVKVMDARTIQILHSQAARERAGTLKKSGKLVVR